MSTLALGGVCTVALAEMNQELHGGDEFEASHDGFAYRFASADALNLFEQDPERFAVRFHGYCPVTANVHGRLVRGNPEIYSMYDKRPVFFADIDAKTLFDEEPDKYMAHHAD